ncbi:acylphosphatase [Fundicoccus culcitae]|uniref:acylphosphatase n=1 Tax=Fundicoccus culcitae TaxID=2969821 RepID=A0ABY5P856_9LACT|nr:acylphosphatase [Fundicoccus culcitae]UUX34573.1 acylphosphatase [Fundicoccus culcitae]
METLEIIVSGRVQGVGYRNYVQQLATKYDIHGNVKNLYSGDVKIIAQAQEDQLKQFVHAIQQPQHRYMKIDQIKSSPLTSSQIFNRFSVEY